MSMIREARLVHDLEFRWRRMGLNYEQRQATFELARKIPPVSFTLGGPPPKPPKPAEPTRT
jgi:hypothetical protein